MKSLKNYITEKLKVSNVASTKSGNKIVVKDNEQLKKIIVERTDHKTGHIDLRDLDVSNVTKFQHTFFGSTSLVSIDIRGWDTSNAKSMEGMFAFCPSVEEIIGIESLNTSKVRDMTAMFKQCHKLEYIDVSNWDVSEVNQFYNMFLECRELKEIEGIENWNPAMVKIHGFEGMFMGCKSLKKLDLSNWKKSPITLTNMFAWCSSLQELNLTDWCTQSNLVDSRQMFKSCSSLKKIWGIEQFNMVHLQEASYMFDECENLVADLSNWDLSKLQKKVKMFNGAKQIKKPKKK